MLFAARLFREARIGLAVLLMGLFLLTPFVARAEGENSAVLEKVTALNQKALDAYNNLEFEEARKLLKQALDLCGTAGLDKHPIKARTHIHMGVVLIAAKQQELGVKQFKKALEIQPDIQVTKELANPEILQAFEEAGNAVPESSGPGPAAAGTPPPPAGNTGGAEAADINHMPISRGKKGKAIAVTAVVSPDLTGYTKLVLSYKAEGSQDFLDHDMRRSGNRFTGEIPADATKGNLVYYFIEAQAADESAVASSGSEEKPYRVALGAGGRGGGDDEGEGEGEGEGDAIGPRLFFALLGGTGIGYTTGNGEVSVANKVSSGFAPASLAQIAPEVGYFISPGFRLSLQFRIQFVSGATPIYLQKVAVNDPSVNVNACGSDHVCTPANGAISAFARASWFFGSESFRPYFSLAAGGGEMRHVVQFTASQKRCGPNANLTCVDTVLAGPVFAGPGGGLFYKLTPNVGLVAEVNSVLGFPKFTYNLDLNAGVAAQF